MTASVAPSIVPHRVNLQGVRRLCYEVDLPTGVPIERVMEPDYFAHVAALLRPGFHIEVLAEDNAFFARLLVRKVERTSVWTYLIEYVDLEAQLTGKNEPNEVLNEDQFEVAFGGAHKWRVVRKSDQHIVHHGESSKAEAMQWLHDYVTENA